MSKSMAEANSTSDLNLNRALCNALGSVDDSNSVMNEEDSIKAIYLEDYVQTLSSIKVSTIPRPTFASYRAAQIENQKKLNPRFTKVPKSNEQHGEREEEQLLEIRITHTTPTHVDTLYAQGLHQNNRSGLFAPPFVLGLEFAGIVISISHSTSTTVQDEKGQRPFEPGDQVWGSHIGSFAERIICPTRSVRHIPSHSSLSQVAGLGAATAPVSYGALMRLAELKRGETCLVHAGAGGLGVVAIQIARAAGALVIATVGSEPKAAVVRDLLRDARGHIPNGVGVVDYTVPDWEQRVFTLTAGKGVDVVYDTVGLVGRSIRCCSYGARIVVVGFIGLGGKMEQLALNRVLLKGIKLLGYRYGETGRRNPQETEIVWRGLESMLNTGMIRPVVYREFKGLECMPDALLALARREVYGKVVVEICDPASVRGYVPLQSKSAVGHRPKL